MDKGRAMVAWIGMVLFRKGSVPSELLFPMSLGALLLLAKLTCGDT